MKLTIEIPVPLPTKNEMLGISRWKRKRLRDLIDQLVSLSIQLAEGVQTTERLRINILQIHLLRAAYFKTIQRSMLPDWKYQNPQLELMREQLLR